MGKDFIIIKNEWILSTGVFLAIPSYTRLYETLRDLYEMISKLKKSRIAKRDEAQFSKVSYKALFQYRRDLKKMENGETLRD